MQTQLCSRCKKNIAVVFITKIENGQTINEGLCLKCAKELGVQPVDDLMKRMGISDEDLEGLSTEMMEVLGGEEDLSELGQEEDGEEEDGKTATFPFLNRLFSQNPPAGDAGGEKPRGEKSRREKGEGKDKKRKFLENYCISLTEKAKTGKLDRIVGRQVELERVIQILNRRQKNNPCLIGEPGVGKTAIAEALAQAIFDGQVPYKLRNKEVYLLDLTALVAGTQFRGQFESRMKGLIEEIRKLGNIILVIDEVHNLVGAGDAEGSMNAANILKPALSRGEIQVIGATTFSEYRKHIEKDTALERRFQPVTVNEPSVEESIKIIQGIACYYEQFHGVRIPPEVARQAVLLSERYITDRFLPDKAIDLLDEACSDVNLKDPLIAQAAQLREQLGQIQSERDQLMAEPDDSNYERLAELKSQELRLSGQLEETTKDGPPCLTVEHLAHVIELWTKIPASRIQEQEFQRLSQLEQRLRAHIIGQDEAVRLTAAAIRRGRVGLGAKRKPVSFIFVGPTGVGKTELVKQLAADLFDSPESLIRLDMSEYMEKYAVSRIIGAPPGYVGYDEAGQLTEKVRRKPYCVILLDEIEKAHPDVLNILLQILDDGRITDAHGRVVNFENTVIVMTSNAGSDKRSSGSAGFSQSVTEQGKERAMKALSEIMRPEFLNRVDEIVAFQHLSREDFKKIAVLMLEELKGSMAERGMTLSWTEEVLEHLVEKSYSMTYGARNLRRTIQRELEDQAATLLIDRYAQETRTLSARMENGTLKLDAE